MKSISIGLLMLFIKISVPESPGIKVSLTTLSYERVQRPVQSWFWPAASSERQFVLIIAGCEGRDQLSPQEIPRGLGRQPRHQQLDVHHHHHHQHLRPEDSRIVSRASTSIGPSLQYLPKQTTNYCLPTTD